MHVHCTVYEDWGPVLNGLYVFTGGYCMRSEDLSWLNSIRTLYCLQTNLKSENDFLLIQTSCRACNWLDGNWSTLYELNRFLLGSINEVFYIKQEIVLDKFVPNQCGSLILFTFYSFIYAASGLFLVHSRAPNWNPSLTL